MNVAIIPARGGSKRIPRKNVRLFHGQPLLNYPIATARACGLFQRILVSTDDEAVAEVARAAGAEVPFIRPPELADDHTGTADVVRHALAWLHGEGISYDLACCLYATTPLLLADDLRRGHDLLRAHPDKQFAFSVTSFAFPIQRAIRLRPDGGVEPIQPAAMPKRSQDLEPAYHDAGQFYWARTGAFEARLSVFSPVSLPVILPRHRVQDIDTPEDWAMAEYLYQAWQMRDRHARTDPD